MRRRCRAEEAGFTLIELTIAAGLLTLVVAGVDGSITEISNQHVIASQETQSIDMLQSAEETLTADVHAATSWKSVPTSTTLDFYAAIDGSNPEVTATISNHTLTVSLNGKVVDTVTSLSGPTKFSPESCHVTLAGVTTTYYVGSGVTLSKNAPSVSAPHPAKVTLSDPTVTAWNIQYSYLTAQEATGATEGCP